MVHIVENKGSTVPLAFDSEAKTNVQHLQPLHGSGDSLQLHPDAEQEDIPLVSSTDSSSISGCSCFFYWILLIISFGLCNYVSKKVEKHEDEGLLNRDKPLVEDSQPPDNRVENNTEEDGSGAEDAYESMRIYGSVRIDEEIEDSENKAHFLNSAKDFSGENINPAGILSNRGRNKKDRWQKPRPSITHQHFLSPPQPEDGATVPLLQPFLDTARDDRKIPIIDWGSQFESESVSPVPSLKKPTEDELKKIVLSGLSTRLYSIQVDELFSSFEKIPLVEQMPSSDREEANGLLIKLKNNEIGGADLSSIQNVQVFVTALSQLSIITQEIYEALGKEDVENADYLVAREQLEGLSKQIFRNCITIILVVDAYYEHCDEQLKFIIEKISDSLLAMVSPRTPQQDKCFRSSLFTIARTKSLSAWFAPVH